MNKLVYNPKEVAKVLNLGICKTYELINNNRIPSVRVGKKILVPKKELMKWLKNETYGGN